MWNIDYFKFLFKKSSMSTFFESKQALLAVSRQAADENSLLLGTEVPTTVKCFTAMEVNKGYFCWFPFHQSQGSVLTDEGSLLYLVISAIFMSVYSLLASLACSLLSSAISPNRTSIAVFFTTLTTSLS